MDKNKQKKLKTALAIIRKVGVTKLMVAIELRDGEWETTRELSERANMCYGTFRYALECLYKMNLVQKKTVGEEGTNKPLNLWTTNKNTKDVSEALTKGII